MSCVIESEPSLLKPPRWFNSRAFAWHAWNRGSIPGRDRPMSLKQVVTSLGNRCECHGSSEMTIIRVDPCHSRCCTLKNPHCLNAMSTEHSSKFAALHRQWWRLHMSEKFSSGTINPTQNKQSKNSEKMDINWYLFCTCYVPSTKRYMLTIYIIKVYYEHLVAVDLMIL